ncbi:MAG: carbamate kinase [Bacteroidales bacterium]|nr:carbamate kinase [Bacteroidales bacterium]MBR6002376.1 carbamate kinase [Bacteroidales bacterium]
MDRLAMIAFGGNALLRAGQKGTFEEQLANVEATCGHLCHLVRRGYGIVIAHGNGPQVGNGLLRQEAGKQVYGLEAMPMDFCGAETQGSIAYLIETALERVLRREGLDRRIVSLVTRVEVSASDPGFANPTKPVGPYYASVPAGGAAVYKLDPAGRGYRKVVASPQPLRIANIDLVERLAREGYIVVTAGGGGIPVAGPEHRGVEAVIDKDLASALAAAEIKADEFYILTDVPKVYINFRKPGEKALDRLSVEEARRYLAEGQFAEGSMAPKVRAAIRFIEGGGKECVITEAGQLGNPACGTRIYK